MAMTFISRILVFALTGALPAAGVAKEKGEVPPMKPVAVSASSEALPSEDSETLPSTRSESRAADASSSVSQAAGQAVLLRYQFQPGEVLRYRMTQIGKLRAEVEDTAEENVTQVDQLRHFEVRSVDENEKASIVMRFESVEMSVARNDGPPVIFHSGMAPDEVPRLFQATAYRLREKAPDFVVLPTGRPADADGQEILRFSDRECEDIERQEQAKVHLMMPLPVAKVRPGDSWKFYRVVKVRVTKEIQREIRLLTSWHLESVVNGIAKITFATSPAAKVRTPSVWAQLIEATPKGHVLFDVEGGRLLRRVSRNDRSVYNALGRNTVLTTSRETIEQLLPQKKQVTKRFSPP